MSKKDLSDRQGSGQSRNHPHKEPRPQERHAQRKSYDQESALPGQETAQNKTDHQGSYATPKGLGQNKEEEIGIKDSSRCISIGKSLKNCTEEPDPSFGPNEYAFSYHAFTASLIVSVILMATAIMPLINNLIAYLMGYGVIWLTFITIRKCTQAKDPALFLCRREFSQGRIPLALISQAIAIAGLLEPRLSNLAIIISGYLFCLVGVQSGFSDTLHVENLSGGSITRTFKQAWLRQRASASD